MTQSANEITQDSGLRIVDVIDRLLDRGVSLRGELWLTVADVELLFIGADLVIASPDTINASSQSVEQGT